MFLLALLSILPASAQDALHYYGNNSNPYRPLDSASISALNDAGATTVDDTTSWPASLDDYQLVILSAGDGTATAFSATQIADLDGLLDRGGVLLIQGENNSFTSHNEAFNTLLGALGSSMSLIEDSTSGGCNNAATITEPTHPLMSGVTALNYAAGADIDPAMGTVLATASGGEGLIAVEGNIVLSADSNMLVRSCTIPEGNLTFLKNVYGLTCDNDEDGATDTACGGDDCDDNNPLIYPGATEIWYDGTDQNCDGWPDYDQDMDGFNSAAETDAGTDCDDLDPAINLDATEIWYDGVDQDCDGQSDYDQDGDGFDSEAEAAGGDDCNDLDLEVNPDATEVWYDGADQNCDGLSDYDQDMDGFDSEAESDSGDDCEDLDDTINPDATEVWYDDIDQDCDGGSDYDRDGDGFESAADGDGDDCDDDEATVFPGATEVADDGIDQDCDGSDLVEDVGCNCASGQAPQGGLLAVALMAGLALLRRRRS